MPEVVTSLLERLIRFESVNPSLDSRGRGESAIGAYIAEFCGERKIQCRLQDVDGDRRNVLASVAGSGEQTLLFVAHLDTVPARGWTRNPFEPFAIDSKLYGRGACDTKASLAAMLAALDSIKTQRPRATIVVAGSIDEEYQKKGARALGQIEPRFAAAVVGEPTDLEMVVAHKGSVRWQIETTGRAAHTSMPEIGVNAIEAMAEVIMRLKKLNAELRKRPHPLTGPPSLTVSLVEGGTDICTVPARCVISIDRRLVPGEVPSDAVAEVSAALREITAKDRSIKVKTVAPPAEDFPVSITKECRLIEVTQKACTRFGGTGEPRGVPYGTDASVLSAAGIPCVIIGPGSIEQAHAIDEHVDLNQVDTAFKIYRQIMLTY